MAMRSLCRLAVLWALLAWPAEAAARLPRVFTDHLVLQQDLPIAVWGWAEAGETVTVTLAGKTVSATADAEGRWRADLPAMRSDGVAQVLTVKAANTIELTDVLVGEVWLCSGQSNMGRPVDADAARTADYPQIRLFNSSGDTPRRAGLDDTTEWTVCSPRAIATAGDSLGPDKGRRAFSEVAYHFGRKLHQTLKVPVGLIQANCGGSTASDWTPLPEVGAKLAYDQLVSKMTHTPGVLYWVRLRGLVPYSVRGVIWYQGEDDGRNPRYAGDLKALIESWRKLWKREDMPFYLAQIAQTTYAGGMLGVWEAQAKVMNSVPQTGLAVSNDVYDGTPNGDFKERLDPATGWPLAGGGNPHPTGRPLVAGRLADIALVKTYGQPERPVFGPMYDSQRVQDGKLTVTFKHVGGGLTTRDGKEPDWFELSDGAQEGNKLKYVKAQARITGADTVEVWSSEVKEPKHVRFGWHALARFNLMSKERLPAVSFRTDSQPHWNR